MNIQLKLDQGDLCKIIAKHFQVLPENIQFEVKESTIGYGINEIQSYIVTCTIDHFPSVSELLLDS